MSTNCGVCGQLCAVEEVDSVVKCAGGCEKSFHTRCIKDDLVGKKTRSYRDWKCKDCRNTSSVHSSVNSAASTSITKDFLVRVLEDFKNEVFGELKTFRSEMGELSTSVKFISDKMDENTQLMKEMKTEFAVMKKLNEELRSKNASLTCELGILRDRVRSMEQYSRRDNIEVSGLPVTPNEDVVALVKDVGAAVGVEIHENDLSAAHRVPSFQKDRTPSLIVKFVRRSTRDTIIDRYREKKGGMAARDVNPAFPQHRMYINEHLSPENKVFLSKLKSKCKDVGYSYAWCRDGKFFVRRCQGEKYKRVDTYEDLAKLK